MDDAYEKARETIKNALNKSFSKQTKDFIERVEKVIKKIVNKGESMDMDLSKILGLIQGLHIVKTKKNKKTAKLVVSLIIASIIALSLGFVIKSYDSISKGKTPEEKIKIFIDNLHLEKLKDNPTIKKVRKEIKALME
ncbi:MAG: hypothetical protein JW791_03425 [Nanoarchaeota archaeon]|nr:hypothetical protein [Nanoarchaeota archaeon]